MISASATSERPSRATRRTLPGPCSKISLSRPSASLGPMGRTRAFCLSSPSISASHVAGPDVHILSAVRPVVARRFGSRRLWSLERSSGDAELVADRLDVAVDLVEPVGVGLDLPGQLCVLFEQLRVRA